MKSEVLLAPHCHQNRNLNFWMSPGIEKNLSRVTVALNVCKHRHEKLRTFEATVSFETAPKLEILTSEDFGDSGDTE